MAKFNGKKGKHRNLAESVLNAYFNSAGIGTKGSKPVEKSIPKMHLGGAPHVEPHPSQGSGQMDAMNQRFMQYQNGTGQGTEMPFYGQQGFGQTGMQGMPGLPGLLGMRGMQGMQGMPSNRFMPEDLDTKYDIGNSLNNMWQGQNFGAVDTSQDTGLNPGQVPAAMAKFLEEQGKTSLKSTGLASAGSFVKNSEFAQGDKTGSDWATAIGGAAQGYGAAIPFMAAVPGVGPFAAAAMAGYSVYDKKNQEYEEGRRLQKERGERSEMVASNALDFSNQVNSMYSDEGNQAGSYYAKYGGAVADLLKKYGHGGSTSNTNYKKYGAGGPLSSRLGAYPTGLPYDKKLVDQGFFDTPEIPRYRETDESDPLVYPDGLSEAEMKDWMLAMKAGEQSNRFHNPITGGTYKEWDPRLNDSEGNNYIEDVLFPNVGFRQSKQHPQVAPPADISTWQRGSPWSAATVSDLAKHVDPNFDTSAAHATYINSSFDKNHDWTSNKVKNPKWQTDKTPYQTGDILFKGSSDSSQPSYKQKFNWFKKQSKDGGGEGGNYRSHSDIIIGQGQNEDGDATWDVRGGNVGNTLSTRTMTRGQIHREYPGFLSFNNTDPTLTEVREHGGPTGQPDYETEGGEVMLASPGDAPVAVGNGNYKQVASNLYQAEGPGHEAGGIATQGATEPFMDASGQSHDSPYVFSDSDDMMFDATDILKLIS